jgi:hypothetical protein
MTKNLRFWAFVNCSPVKLTLRPGQTLGHYVGSRTEEGWESETHTWTALDNGVLCEWGTDGRDCDGRLSQAGESFAPFEALAAGGSVDGAVFPRWEHGQSSQRDEYAERAGY